MPGWLATVGNLFPLKHFVHAFAGAFNPTLSGSGFAWVTADGSYGALADLAVMAGWGLVAALFALRWFKWEPRGG